MVFNNGRGSQCIFHNNRILKTIKCSLLWLILMNLVIKPCLLIIRKLIELFPNSRSLKVLYSRVSPSIKSDHFARSHGVVELLAYLGKLDTNQPITEEYIVSRFRSKASRYDSIVEKAGYLQHELELCSESTISITDSLCKKPVSILDIGCGTGLLARRLFQKGIIALIDGVDLSPEMLQEAHRRNIYSNLFIHKSSFIRMW